MLLANSAARGDVNRGPSSHFFERFVDEIEQRLRAGIVGQAAVRFDLVVGGFPGAEHPGRITRASTDMVRNRIPDFMSSCGRERLSSIQPNGAENSSPSCRRSESVYEDFEVLGPRQRCLQGLQDDPSHNDEADPGDWPGDQQGDRQMMRPWSQVTFVWAGSRSEERKTSAGQQGPGRRGPCRRTGSCGGGSAGRRRP